MHVAEEQSTGPQRQCAFSRERAPREALLRMHLGPDATPYVDVRGRGPGRGLYVAPAVLREALSPKGLRKVFRGKARELSPLEIETLVAETVTRLVARIEELLGLARRAGGLTLGMDATCREVEGSPRELVVIVAEDVSERSRGRIERALESAPRATALRLSTRARIGHALGRETVGVAAISHPVLGQRILDEYARWAALRGQRPPQDGHATHGTERPNAGQVDETAVETRKEH